MKKLILFAILAVTITPLFIVLSSHILGIRFMGLAESIGLYFGRAMAAVGVISILLVCLKTGEKEKIYQGAYFTLLGVAISSYSLTAFIASVVLIAWIDFKGHSLR